MLEGEHVDDAKDRYEEAKTWLNIFARLRARRRGERIKHQRCGPEGCSKERGQR